jgi:hypothetical protein
MNKPVDQTAAVRSGIGTSQLNDAVEAGRQAATAAMTSVRGLAPDLVIAYGSVRYDLPAVLAGIRAVTGDAPLVGATSSGHLHAGSLMAPGDGVAVLTLAGGGYRFGVAHAEGADTDAFGAGQNLARAARADGGPDPAPYEAILVLSDGLGVDQHGLLNGIHAVLGFNVPVIGGAAGDDRRLSRTSVFRGDHVHNGAAVAVWIGSSHPLSVVFGQGWQPTGMPFMVTSVDGPIVHEIGGRDALLVYREHFRHANPDDEVATDRQGGYHSAHAFGVIQPDGSFVVNGAYVDDVGNLRTFSPMPQYAAVQVVSCGPDDLLEVGEETVRSALVDADAGVVLVFDCVARLDILGERGEEEAEALQRGAGDVPTFGFYTYGEFARTSSASGYHNATVAAMAL